ncbi:Zn-dependent hydrolase [Gonapodya prolifera JEL478]|uniref:Zn-dependent hydrolase n=1 Tax=Gonapodya prolifera (strain JEL478) TaxID=1344416 RepID=A0A139ATN2_GONPJ|nr:Zn-dependent hydrolase [Gonapodya prolifera JEL478]|eukprot:KXS20088.1 Zn-dependent hydrolase [Gonapodya prolifera JEL478]
MLRWTIGDVRITSVPESESLTSPRFLFPDVDKKKLIQIADRHPWLYDHFVTDKGMMRQKIHALVVDTGKERIVVDTCIGNDKKRHNKGWNNLQTDFLSKMNAAGYPPESITHVICTHLHVDHVGWNTRLVGGKWVPTFPNAKYLFAKPEFEHWSQTAYADGDDIFSDSVKPIYDAGLAQLVPLDCKVGECVQLEPTTGHTPGHVSVRIRSRGKTAVITGDMTHTPVQIAEPGYSSGFDSDPEKARQTRHEAFARWSDGATLVIGTHFATPTAGRLVKVGDAYVLDTKIDENAKL